ncbi:hypothetical protein SDC9_109331 [bioreactor metagenome]|uniref:Uncharacterized protein n=1 Tax=bioreactor metagenome TaxID=1076179 RepID=A0A645BAF8_9ZZZZ
MGMEVPQGKRQGIRFEHEVDQFQFFRLLIPVIAAFRYHENPARRKFSAPEGGQMLPPAFDDENHLDILVSVQRHIVLAFHETPQGKRQNLFRPGLQTECRSRRCIHDSLPMIGL